jgi:hypothetical protein
MRTLTLFALLAGCGYGDDSSHFGDLLQHQALRLVIGFNDPDTVSISIGNRFSDAWSNCLSLGTDLNATLDGQPAPVGGGYKSETGDFGETHDTCPGVEFKGLVPSDDPLLLILTDGGRPAGDRFRTFTTLLYNPLGRQMTIAPSPGPDGVVGLQDGEQLSAALPPGERVSLPQYEAGPNNCMDDGHGGIICTGSASGTEYRGNSLSFTPRKTGIGPPYVVHFAADALGDTGECPNAVCSSSIFREAGAEFTVE